MKAIMLFLILLVPQSTLANDYRLNIGFYTDHYSSEYDWYEKSELIALTMKREDNLYSAISFVNSYAAQSYALAYGREVNYCGVRLSAHAALIHGYKRDKVPFVRNGLLVAPLLIVNYKVLTVALLPEAFNVSYEFSF